MDSFEFLLGEDGDAGARAPDSGGRLSELCDACGVALGDGELEDYKSSQGEDGSV